MTEMITFKYLREIQNKERSSSELCELDANFYTAVREYLNRKKRMKERSKALSFKEMKEIENIGPVVKSIYNTRERKLVNGALKAARTGIKMVNILHDEERLFEDIKTRLKKSRSELESIQNHAETDSHSDKPKKVDDNSSHSKIRILEEIPEFVSEDLKTYGPWKNGDCVMCPENFAEIFVKNKKAQDAD